MKRHQRLHGLIHPKSLLFRMPENHIVGHDVVPGAFHAGVFLPKDPAKLLIGRMIQPERFPAYHHDKKDLFLRENRKILSEKSVFLFYNSRAIRSSNRSLLTASLAFPSFTITSAGRGMRL